MAELEEVQKGQDDAALTADLKERVCDLIEVLTNEGPSAEQDYANLLTRLVFLWVL